MIEVFNDKDTEQKYIIVKLKNRLLYYVISKYGKSWIKPLDPVVFRHFKMRAFNSRMIHYTLGNPINFAGGSPAKPAAKTKF